MTAHAELETLTVATMQTGLAGLAGLLLRRQDPGILRVKAGWLPAPRFLSYNEEAEGRHDFPEVFSQRARE